MTTAPVTVRPHSAFRTLLASEARLFVRSLAGVVWTAVAPIAAVVALGCVPATSRKLDSLHGLSYLDAYLPILMMFALCMSVVNLLPPTLATYREKGILRRMSTTPVPPSRLLAAQAVIYVGLAVAVAALLLVIGVTAFDVTTPAKPIGFALSLALSAAACTGLAMVVAGLAPNARIANGLSLGLFFPLMFLAGLWLPRASMPSPLRGVSDASPLGAGVRCVQASIDGHWPPLTGLLVLAVWALVSSAVAVRWFRWE